MSASHGALGSGRPKGLRYMSRIRRAETAHPTNVAQPFQGCPSEERLTQTYVDLFPSQDDDRIDAGGATGWQITREKGHHCQKPGNAREGQRIERADLE